VTPPVAPTVLSPAPPQPAAVRDDARLRAWVAFLQAHSALSHRLEAELQAAGHISLAEYDALVQLAAADEQRLRMNELADRVLLSRSGVSRLVDRLERQGWVQRATCPTDARGSWAVLTDAGLDRLRAAAPVHLAGVERHFLAVMDEADRAALTRALGAVLAALGGRGVPLQPGACLGSPMSPVPTASDRRVSTDA
jgi:DNA-binding MarR family transcriptional regulator